MIITFFLAILLSFLWFQKGIDLICRAKV